MPIGLTLFRAFGYRESNDDSGRFLYQMGGKDQPFKLQLICNR
jgi:hypothetical protein